MVTKTPDEIDAMSPAELKEHLADEEKTVFGRDRLNEPAFKKVKGQPIETGIGSPGRENGNHFAAIKKYQGEDAYQEALTDIWKRDPDHAKKLSLPRPKAKAAA
jgi:hypothetical protein